MGTVQKEISLSTKQNDLINKAKEFNAVAGQVLAAMNLRQEWPKVFGELFDLSNKDNVEIKHIFISAGSKQITMNAVAPTRQIATTFKDALDKSQYFGNTNLPLGSFNETQENVSFTLNLTLK